jgi:hypothetical protein
LITRKPYHRWTRWGLSSAAQTPSGEAFREIHLEPALREGKQISVELDGTIGYGSSFLEEAFGGLVRSLRLQPKVLQSRLQIKTEDQALLDEVNSYIEEAAQKLS